MELKEYITEYVSSGRSVMGYTSVAYTPFPKDRKDSKAIQEWLEENGFTKVRGTMGSYLSEHFFATGEKCYQNGPYSRDKATHWFRFYDGNVVIFIRTCDMPYLLHHRELRICTMKDPEDSSGGEVSYEEIVKYFK